MPVRYTSLREILAVETEGGPAPLGRNLFQLIEKIADYYLATVAACLRLIVPPHSVKVVKRFFITEEGRAAIVNRALPEEVQAVLRKLEWAPNGLLRSSFTQSMKHASATLVSV
jgi:primosomal protein N'